MDIFCHNRKNIVLTGVSLAKNNESKPSTELGQQKLKWQLNSFANGNYLCDPLGNDYFLTRPTLCCCQKIA